MIGYRNLFRRELGRGGEGEGDRGEGGRIRQGSQGEGGWRSWGLLFGTLYSVVLILACVVGGGSSGPSKDEAGDRWVSKGGCA